MNTKLKKLLLVALLEEDSCIVQRYPKSFWVHPVLQSRAQHGEYHRLVMELRLFGVEFQRYFRMDRCQFDMLLCKIGESITRRMTNYRKPITPAERLAICLRFLATGDSYRSIGYSYRVGHSTVAGIVSTVSEAIWDGLVQEYMPVPKEEDWRFIAEEFQEKWHFRCLGAIDGKHVLIQAPPCSGSQFFNYKGTYSIVLLAVVDANYFFRVIDVGAYGRGSDGGTLRHSAFGQALQNGTLGIPTPAPLPGADHLGPVPFVFVGDEAFPLKPNLMRPYAGSQAPGSPTRIFNYRLSRARLVVECTFGILTARWRMYRRVLALKPENVETCVKATCILHNFLRRCQGSEQSAQMEISVLTDSLRKLTQAGSNNGTREANEVRKTLTKYFCSPAGAVPWQHSVV